MITAALLGLCGGLRASIVVPHAIPVDLVTSTALSTMLSEARRRISASLEHLRSDLDQRGVTSSTFGSDDPLTLTWLAELAFNACRDDAKWAHARDEVRKRLSRIQKRPDDEKFIGSNKVNTVAPVGVILKSSPNTFPTLREVQIASVASEDQTQWAESADLLRRPGSAAFCLQRSGRRPIRSG